MVEQACIYGLLWVGSVFLARALPFPSAWRDRKPLGCDACLTLWCALTSAPIWLFGLAQFPGWVEVGAGYGLAVSILKIAGRSTPPEISSILGDNSV